MWYHHIMIRSSISTDICEDTISERYNMAQHDMISDMIWYQIDMIRYQDDMIPVTMWYDDMMSVCYDVSVIISMKYSYRNIWYHTCICLAGLGSTPELELELGSTPTPTPELELGLELKPPELELELELILWSWPQPWCLASVSYISVISHQTDMLYLKVSSGMPDGFIFIRCHIICNPCYNALWWL